MIKIAVCDDEQRFVEQIKKFWLNTEQRYRQTSVSVSFMMELCYWINTNAGMILFFWTLKCHI